MDCCSKYSDYSGTTHPMASRVGDGVLSGGPPNRMAPNVTLVAGHRHQQALRYQEQQHRLAALHSSEGLYQQQQHGFNRYLPSVSYPGYHPASYATAGLSYGNLGRREAAAYLNHHTHHAQHSHHLYHPPHYDSTYNGRMIGGAGGAAPLSYHPYRDVYEHPQGVPSSVLHYTPRNSAFQYEHHLSPASPASQQREYLHYYPYHPFASEQRYGQHNLHSINGLQLLSSKNDGRAKGDGQHITDAEASYAQHQQQQQQQQQHQQQNLPASSLGITMIASPMASGSTTTDSGISGSSRCGSTPISTVTMNAGYSGEYSMTASSTEGSEEGSVAAKDSKDVQRSLPPTPDTVDDGRSSTKDHQFSPKPPCIKSSLSPSESEKAFSGKLCASSRRMECSTPMIPTPERCGTPFISNTRPPTSFQSPHRYQTARNKWSPSHCETSEATSFSPKPFSPKPFSPKPRKKRIYSPVCMQRTFEPKKNRVVECDLIPSKKSKRKLEPPKPDEIREEIRDIKPLPGFQQAFGSTEIGRFFETFLNIPASPYDSVYSYESEADTMSPQPWEIENSVDGSQYDVQISASLQSVYKSSIGDKNYLSEIRCNGY